VFAGSSRLNRLADYPVERGAAQWRALSVGRVVATLAPPADGANEPSQTPPSLHQLAAVEQIRFISTLVDKHLKFSFQ